MSGSLAAFMFNILSEALDGVPHCPVVPEDIYSRIVRAGV